MEKINVGEKMKIIRDKINENIDYGLKYTLTYSFLNNVNNLYGTMPTTGIVSARFKATSDYLKDTLFKINNIDYVLKLVGDIEEIQDDIFIKNDIVSCNIDTDKKILYINLSFFRAQKSPFGDGSDGDLVIESGQTVVLPVNMGVLTKQYKNINIKTGGTLTTSGINYGLVLKCQGTCNISGIINQSGKAGFPNPNIEASFPDGLRGGNAGNGGAGAYNDGSGSQYTGGGLGAAGTLGYAYGGGFGGAGGGGGGGNVAWTNMERQAATHGTPALQATVKSYSIYGIGGQYGIYYRNGVLVYGGEGGRGGSASAGGGGVFIYAGGDVTIVGSILCDGISGSGGGFGGDASGSGNNSSFGGRGGGGGGGSGGGVIYIGYNKTINTTGKLSVSGGKAGIGGLSGKNTSGTVSGKNGFEGTAGAIGMIRIEKFEPK